jgi:hypothetical protein
VMIGGGFLLPQRRMNMNIKWKRIWRAVRIIFATIAIGLKPRRIG